MRRLVHGEHANLRYGRIGVRTIIAGWITWYLRKGTLQDPDEPNVLRAAMLPVTSAVVIAERWSQGRHLDGSPFLACLATIEFRP